MSDIDWSVFTVPGPSTRPAAIAALSAFFYFNRPVHQIAVDLAEGIDRYVKDVGPDALTTYTAASGRWKPWTTRTLSKDLKHLRNFPADHEAMHISYDSEPVPGSYGIALMAADLTRPFERARANLLRFDWPVSRDPESIVKFVTGVLESISAESANVGLAFKRTEGSKSDATLGVHQKLPRYLGFDPCYSDVRDDMRGHILTAHWLNYINEELTQQLGGFDAIAAKLPTAEVRRLTRGTLIRGSRLPPIGDINRGAMDLGLLPDVARLLKPLRAQISAFGEPNFDAGRWLARLDELPSRDWDNSHVP